MIYTLLCTAIADILSLISLFCQNKEKPQLKSKRMSSFFAMASTLLFIPYMTTAVIAYIHGADLESLQRLGILRAIHAIQNSPVVDKSASPDQQGNILIYYRFGCRDCEAVYDDLKAEVEGRENIYWIASRQSEGQKLLQKYTVSEVPAGVIIQGDGMYVSHVLCNIVYDRSNETGYMQLDTHALNRLLELQKREK